MWTSKKSLKQSFSKSSLRHYYSVSIINNLILTKNTKQQCHTLYYQFIHQPSFQALKEKKKQLIGHEGKWTILTASVCEHSLSGLVFMPTGPSTWWKTLSASASYSVSFWAFKPYFCNHFSEVKYSSVICFDNGWSHLPANKENK